MGIFGNETADAFVKRVITYGEIPNFKISDFFCVSINDLFSNDGYLNRWSNIKGIFNKIYVKSKKLWFFRLPLSRVTIVIVSRLRSNHYNLNHSLFRKNLIDDPSCLCGFHSQDFEHVFNCSEMANNTCFF